MCAIIGVVGKVLPTEEQFEKARDVMRHRGPNDAGLYYDKASSVALGHRRLSIIDLSPLGKQPLWSNDKRFVITFNGEIYNYLELKKEIGQRYVFTTNTDNEVLLAAYSLWGKDCLSRLNGMFAFAIWDAREKTLFCARDHIGIKPFFYSFENETFTFASEIKALLTLSGKRLPNESMIFDYLYYGMYDHTPETFFAGIKRLPAGHYAVIKNNTLTITKYWELEKMEDQNTDTSTAHVHEQFKELLKDAVKLQFRSDVPVGIDLSSGLDSNSLLFFGETVTQKTIDTFSLCLPSEEYNECSMISEYLNEEQKKKWHTTEVSPQDVFSLIEKTNEIQTEPFGGIPTIANGELYRKAAADQVTVLLEGQGGDELLGGYAYYAIEHEKDTRGTHKKDSSLAYSQDRTALIDHNILHQKFIGKYKKQSLDFQSPFSTHLLNAQYRDLVYAKLPRELRFVDHLSMAYGRELRVPLLDYRIVEFCFSLSAQYKIRGNEQKVLLRDVMKEYLPEVVRRAPKKSFSAIQVEWLRSYYKDATYILLNSQSFKKRPYWNHDALMKKADRFFEGEGNNSFFLWQCINLELWLRRFID